MEPIWATLLAKALEGKNVKDLLSNVGAGGGAPATGGAGPAAGGGAVAAVEATKEPEPEEEKEESDEDMVRGHLHGPFPPMTTNNFVCRASVCSIDIVILTHLVVSLHALHNPHCISRLSRIMTNDLTDHKTGGYFTCYKTAGCYISILENFSSFKQSCTTINVLNFSSPTAYFPTNAISDRTLRKNGKDTYRIQTS
jgi:hypothetical protein